MTDIIIRKIKQEDLDAVVDIENSCFSMPWKRADFEDILTNPDREYFVAQIDDKVVGGCMLTLVSGEGDISNVAVLEAFRGHHIATKLLDATLSYGESCGITEFTLEVRQSNQAAIKLYENAGFISEGIRPNFYEKPKENALIMWRR